MTSVGIVVVGETVADAFISPRRNRGRLDLSVRPGGGPMNTAVALGRLGTAVAFLGRLSSGPVGELIREHLAGSSVDYSRSVSASEPPTMAITAVDPAGHASYDFYADGTADWQWTAAELADRRPAAASCVHAGSLALILEPSGPLIERLLADVRPRATISIDPNVRPRLVPRERYRERIESWTRLADILRLSDEDLAEICPDGGRDPRRGDWVDRVFDDARHRWHRDGVRLIVLTKGPEGAVASLDGEVVRVPAPAIEPGDMADTVGAGDAFNAGMLHWLDARGHLGGRLDGLTTDVVRDAMIFAARVAARTCEVPGADPPWGDPVL